ncbi:MAG: 1-acyl-sn-glycerol-3-phosphate acyltransferase [Planctomycetota bacterium]|jgi:1-acyl-sn-glycerol-3-phosphate acyltransferase|nr:MAG: 1-acyl-sn-glycerol-3-phosphate acyltransferase [Planctomycetota bacterium]
MTSLLVADSKYQFIPPHEGRFWPRLLGRLTPRYLKRKHGITHIEVRGGEIVKELQKSGHRVLLAPNHCRMSDAVVLQSLASSLQQPFYVMASAHLFRGNRLLAWVLRRLGAFSVYREGVDRVAIQKGIDILVQGDRPLVLFPEGALSHANDHLNVLQEGVSFIARSAAAKLEKSADAANRPTAEKVYTVPVAIRYVYAGDIEATAGAMLDNIERRLSWQPQKGQCLVQRIYRVGNALLSLKEQEYLGQSQTGTLDERLDRLINHILVPLESEWCGGPKAGTAILRVKEIRRAILPAMIDGQLKSDEMERRWRQLTAAGFAQSLSLYPSRYVITHPTVDRILETVERFNEHLNGDETPHGPMKAIIQVGDPIEVCPKRDRSAKSDPLMAAIECALKSLLEKNRSECVMYDIKKTTPSESSLPV